MTELTTRRLTLRTTDDSDAELLEKLQKRQAVADYIGELRLAPAGSHRFTIVRRGTPLGHVALVKRRGRSEPELHLVCALLAEAEGCGIATEACERVLRWAAEDLALSKVLGTVHVENTQSAELVSRLGMVRVSNDSSSSESTYVKHLSPAT